MTALTTVAEMQRMLSSAGVLSFSDHNQDGLEDDGVVDDCIVYATGFVGGMLAKLYPITALASGVVVRECATIVACRTLCTRRGNPVPESLENRYDEVVRKDGILDVILRGQMQVLDVNGTPIRGNSFAPTMSNVTVDRRYRDEKIRVKRHSSTPVDSSQERDNADNLWETPYGV